jgi:hypothetical protein
MKNFLLAWLFLVASSAHATTFYVQPLGSNTACTGLSTADYPGSGTNQTCAFASPVGCFTHISAGDTCSIMDGTYVCTPASNNYPCFNACLGPSGTDATHQTIYKSHPGANPKFCIDSGCSAVGSSNGAVLGASAGFSPAPLTVCKFIQFDGLDVDGGLIFHGEDWNGRCDVGGASCAHSGQCASGACTGAFSKVTDIEVKNGYFEGGFYCDNNYGPVRFENVARINFHHNTVTDMTVGDCTQLSSPNPSLLKIYPTYDSIIEYNNFLVGTGYAGLAIDIKDSSVSNIFRYNLIDQNIRIGQQARAGYMADNQIYGNVLKGILGSGRADGTLIHHNVLQDDFSSADQCSQDPFQGGRYYGSATNEFRDNIMLPSTDSLFGKDTWAVFSGWKFDHNVYGASHVWYPNRWSSSPSVCSSGSDTTDTSLAAWTTTVTNFPLAVGSRETGSLGATSCTYVDTTYYDIASGACLTASSTGGKVGPFGLVSCIGAACGVPVTPSTPTHRTVVVN